MGEGRKKKGGSSIQRASHTTQCHHPNLRARCQKWTICSAPGGRWSALMFSCCFLACCRRVSFGPDKNKRADVCELSASPPSCLLSVFVSGTRESECVHIVSAAGRSSSRQAVIAENGALRVYCAAIMERLMCHTFINTLSGACMVFATHLLANCAFMTLIRAA